MQEKNYNGTINSQCVEESDLVYNDGVKILYFNTTGTIGGTEALSNFLRYLEESKATNVVDEATKEIDNYVGVIKNNYAIGGRYMTVGDLIDKIVDEAVDEAIAEKDAELERLRAQLEAIKGK